MREQDDLVYFAHDSKSSGGPDLNEAALAVLIAGKFVIVDGGLAAAATFNIGEGLGSGDPVRIGVGVLGMGVAFLDGLRTVEDGQRDLDAKLDTE